MKSRKAQEEIVGFVVIVVIVAVIFLIFLSISVRQPRAENRADESILQFLESMSRYTTDCAISYEPAYSTVNDLILQCYTGKTCTSGEGACDVLNRTLSGLIQRSWHASQDGPVKGYLLNITYRTNISSSEEVIFSLKAGNCSSGFKGNEILTPPVFTYLEICS